MAAEIKVPATQTLAVVTGANKGIGLEICRQLASHGILVILTARNEKRGSQAVETLKSNGLHNVIFHQLDVLDSSSMVSLADFIKGQFGKLDILVNNAGIVSHTAPREHDLKNFTIRLEDINTKALNKVFVESYDTIEACVTTNYFAVKQLTKHLLPLLQLSDSPRIVNVSSSLGKLEHIGYETARKQLENGDGLTEEVVDEVVKEFLEDAKKGLFESKGWAVNLVGYRVSKAVLTAYTRVLAKNYPNIAVNAVCPGYCKTDFNYNRGILTVEEGAKGPVKLALMPRDGPSGMFYQNESPADF